MKLTWIFPLLGLSPYREENILRVTHLIIKYFTLPDCSVFYGSKKGAEIIFQRTIGKKISAEINCKPFTHWKLVNFQTKVSNSQHSQSNKYEFNTKNSNSTYYVAFHSPQYAVEQIISFDNKNPFYHSKLQTGKMKFRDINLLALGTVTLPGLWILVQSLMLYLLQGNINFIELTQFQQGDSDNIQLFFYRLGFLHLNIIFFLISF